MIGEDLDQRVDPMIYLKKKQIKIIVKHGTCIDSFGGNLNSSASHLSQSSNIRQKKKKNRFRVYEKIKNQKGIHKSSLMIVGR